MVLADLWHPVWAWIPQRAWGAEASLLISYHPVLKRPRSRLVVELPTGCATRRTFN